MGSGEWYRIRPVFEVCLRRQTNQRNLLRRITIFSTYTKALVLSLALVGCSASTKQTQLTAADAISQGINTTVPTIVEQYRVDLRTCRTEAAGDPAVYIMCAGQVEERWSHFKDVWRRFRRMQDAYASALETKEPNLAVYAQWLQTAFCELKSAAPESLKIPSVPGVVCKDD